MIKKKNYTGIATLEERLLKLEEQTKLYQEEINNLKKVVTALIIEVDSMLNDEE